MLNSAAVPGAPARSDRLALTGLAIVVLMPSLDTSIANAALPVLARAFQASFQSAQWIVLSYLIAITALIVGAGQLGDRTGRRRLLLAAIALFTMASLGCAIAPSLPAMLVARAGQGLGAAAMMAMAIALVRDAVAAERTGRAMGLLGSMSAVGTALGPSLGGVLTATLGWPAIFLVNIPLGAAAFVLVRRHVADERVPHMRRPRAFVPRLPTVLNAAIARRLVISGLVSTVMMATLVVGPFYLSRSLALTPMATGFALSIGPVVTALSGVPAGRVVDRAGTSLVIVLGLCGVAAGALVLAITPFGFGLAAYLPPIVLMTSAYASFQAANNTALMSAAGVDHRGAISGMLSLSRNVGLMTGTALMGAVFAFGSGPGNVMLAPPEAIAAGMRTTFAAAAALIVIALAIAVRDRNTTNHQ